MREKNQSSSAFQMGNLQEKEDEYIYSEKDCKITINQLRFLFTSLTHCGTSDEVLSIVKKEDTTPYSYDYVSAFEDCIYDEDHEKHYNKLKNKCLDDEVVVYKYFPYSLHRMLDMIENRIEIYGEEEEAENPQYYNDLIFQNFCLIRDILKRNID